MTDKTSQHGTDPIDADIKTALGQSAEVAVRFTQELLRVRAAMDQTGQDIATLEKGLSSGLNKAIDSVVLQGKSLSDALNIVAQSMINAAYSAAVKPVSDHLGSVIANGIGAIVGAPVMAGGGTGSVGVKLGAASQSAARIAQGAPIRQGGDPGLSAKAGDHPLTAQTKAIAGQAVTVVMNVTTPDVQGFKRSEGQIAAQLGRALGRGRRNR